MTVFSRTALLLFIAAVLSLAKTEIGVAGTGPVLRPALNPCFSLVESASNSSSKIDYLKLLASSGLYVTGATAETHPTTGIQSIFFKVSLYTDPFLAERLIKHVGAFRRDGELYLPFTDAINKFLPFQNVRNIRLIPDNKMLAEKMDYWRALAEGRVFFSALNPYHDLMHALGYVMISQTTAWPRALGHLRVLFRIYDDPSAPQKDRKRAGQLIEELAENLDSVSGGLARTGRLYEIDDLGPIFRRIESELPTIRPRWTPETLPQDIRDYLSRP